MKTILLFGAGKSTTVLIDYLIREAPAEGWTIVISDASLEQIIARTGNSPFTRAVKIDITQAVERSSLIREADIVISMMPPSLHHLIARDCIFHGKNLLTASYLDDAIRQFEQEIVEKKLLFICELGLDPGIDHMSAMKLLDEIKKMNGQVTSFKSHCGGLVAPESDNNPWHYKISWNPRSIVLAGKAGARYKLNNSIYQKDHAGVFEDCSLVNIDGLEPLAFYPNRDSTFYTSLYRLENAATFMRTTLRYPSFCKGWNALVAAGLTDDTIPVNPEGLTIASWASPVVLFLNTENQPLLQWLGLFEEVPVPAQSKTSADVLQYLIEQRLAMDPSDRDMIVMLHEISFVTNGRTANLESSLVVKGEDSSRTAMAKTVGLPLGIATRLILNGTIKLSGLHIPTIREIYEPVLEELEFSGIRFRERRWTG